MNKNLLTLGILASFVVAPLPGAFAQSPTPTAAKPVATVAPPYPEIPTPQAGTVKQPIFVADTSTVPELQAWGHVAQALCEVWYPKVCAILSVDDSKRPALDKVTIFIEKMDGVAYAAGGNLHISADWVKSHPNDYGMVIHELTHLVQRYPSYEASWLVEGIADYVRNGYFEPAIALPTLNFEKAKHTDAYKTTAAFLIWLDKNGQKGIVQKLSNSLVANTYKDTTWKELTGKDAAALWQDFAKATGTPKPTPNTASAAAAATQKPG
jgi:hypothetical protein